MARKVKVNQDACIGCGACAAAYSDIFNINDEGKSEVVADPAEDQVDDIIATCPVAAIEEE